MRIDNVVITVTDVTSAAAYYAGTLGLPITEHGDEVEVQLGVSTLTLRPGPAFDGVHHLAFGIAPEDFDTALAFARAHLTPIVAGDSDVIDGPEGWDSRSVYFLGPEGIVLEYIAREAHRGLHAPGSGVTPRVLCLSEIGIGVDDVSATVARLGRAFGLPPFAPQSDVFAPVGDHDGLLIVVDSGRTWFPTRDSTAPQGPLAVTLTGDGGRAFEELLSPVATAPAVEPEQALRPPPRRTS